MANERIAPDYRLPVSIPICPVHGCRMYINRHENVITRYRCPHSGCSEKAKSARVKHVAITSLPVEFREKLSGNGSN